MPREGRLERRAQRRDLGRVGPARGDHRVEAETPRLGEPPLGMPDPAQLAGQAELAEGRERGGASAGPA